MTLVLDDKLMYWISQQLLQISFENVFIMDKGLLATIDKGYRKIGQLHEIHIHAYLLVRRGMPSNDYTK